MKLTSLAALTMLAASSLVLASAPALARHHHNGYGHRSVHLIYFHRHHHLYWHFPKGTFQHHHHYASHRHYAVHHVRVHHLAHHREKPVVQATVPVTRSVAKPVAPVQQARAPEAKPNPPIKVYKTVHVPLPGSVSGSDSAAPWAGTLSHPFK